jgi:hypothetical protein
MLRRQFLLASNVLPTQCTEYDSLAPEIVSLLVSGASGKKKKKTAKKKKRNEIFI